MSRSSASVLCLSCSNVNSAMRSSYSVLYFCKDLIEMMPQVVHVVADQVFERCRRIFVHEVEGDLIESVWRARFGQDVFRYHRSDVYEVQVVRTPKLNHFRPRFVLVFLRADPVVLLVPG